MSQDQPQLHSEIPPQQRKVPLPLSTSEISKLSPLQNSYPQCLSLESSPLKQESRWLQTAEVESIEALGGVWLSSRIGTKLGSSFLPPPVASIFLEPVTLVVSLMNQQLETPLSHVAQIGAVFLRTGFLQSITQPVALSLLFYSLVPLKSTQ